MGRTTHRKTTEEWAIGPKSVPALGRSFMGMKSAARRVFLFVEEGAAFAEFEGRHLDRSRKDPAMNTLPEHTTHQEPHFAPVEAWDAIAADYDAHVTPGEAGLATQVLRLAGLERGHRFLDVAAGTGGLSLPAARLGAKGGAIDWSRNMIA